MQNETVDTVIVGGGLSGLYAAYLLHGQGIAPTLLEGRERPGGRILSAEHAGYFADLGPSWYWPDIHPAMAQFVDELGIQGFRQFEEGLGRFQRFDGMVRTVGGFHTEPLSWRLPGGMEELVRRLCHHIPEGAVRLGQPVCAMERAGSGVLVTVGELEKPPRACIMARHVILALPPRLAASSILFSPDLTHELTQAMLKIGTWMAGQAKFYALYDKPFWREAGLSGQAFSERGPLSEIHDGSNEGVGPFGLTGFVGIPAAQRGEPAAVAGATVAQLEQIFGPEAARPEAVFYRDWAAERFTATQLDQAPMREHPHYSPPAGQTSFWNSTVHFAGTETADCHGGYLEGALSAARRAVAETVRGLARDTPASPA